MSRRAYPSYPSVPTQFVPSGSSEQTASYGAHNNPSQPHPVGGYQAQLPGQQGQNLAGQPMQNYYGPPMSNPPQAAVNAPPSSAQIPGQAGQAFPNQPTGTVQPSTVSSLAAGVQQMQMAPHAGSLPPGPAMRPPAGQFPPPPTTVSQGPSQMSAHGPPTGLRTQVSMPQPGTLGPPPSDLQLTGQASGQIPGRSLSAGQLPPPNGAVLSGQATGQLAGRTVSAGQLPPPPGPAVTEQRTGQLAGQAALQPPGQMFPARRTGGRSEIHPSPSSGQAMPPPPLTGQVMPPPPLTGQARPLPPTSGQAMPPPPRSGQAMPQPPRSGQMLPPPPSSGQSLHSQLPTVGQRLPPPPVSGQALPPPPTSGQALPLPPTSGQAMLPPPTSGQAMPPPPTSGQAMLPPPTSGQAMLPPPTSGHAMLPPRSLTQAMPGPLPTSGQVVSGHPPTSGQPFLPPPPTSGQVYPPQPTSGQVFPPPPTSGQVYPPQPTSGLAFPPPPTSGQAFTPSPTSGQIHPPPPPTVGQGPPTAGQALPTGPGLTGQPPRGLQAGPHGPLAAAPPGSMAGPQMMAAPGQVRPAGSGQAAAASGQHPGRAPLDPELQPINLLENRNILPATPLKHPEATLPGNLGRYNSKPSVFCCTMNAIPSSSGLLGKLKLPLAVHIHPYREMGPKECPVLHPGIIVRCRVCRAYINPFVTFVDARHWRCNLCFRANSLPEDFDFNPSTGKHGDRTHRMEIRRATVEYIAPSEYMLRPPQPCVYYFLVDVSYNAVESGVLGVFCRTLLDNLAHLPGDARTLVGILTFDSTLHFYNLSSSLSQPQMLVVSDVDDVFLPSPNSLLVNLRESRELIRTLLEDLPGIFANNRSIHSALGPALQAAEKLLHPIGGRVTVLMSTLPNVGPGSLKYRDVAPSSVKMDTLNMAPASDFYKKLALECSSQQIAVDLFCFSGQFIDVSTVSCISKFSSGQVFYYPDFHHRKETSRQKFEQDLKRYLTRKIGFEAVMRVRCTEGLSLHTFHGNFFVRSTDLLSLPNVNPDHGYAMNIAIDENLKDGSAVCFQAALLYTSSKGERRIRVHTLCLPVSKQPAQIYAKLDIQAMAGVLAKMAVDRAASATLGDAREALLNIVLDCTRMYRSHFASSMQASQFALPSSLRLLPLFMLSLLKHPAFSLNSKISYDVRTHAMNLIKTLPLDYLMAYIHPRMYAVHLLTEKDVVEDEEGKESVTAPILQLSAEKMTRYGMFLMDYGVGMQIWVSKDAPQELIQKILGVKHFGAIPETMVSLPALENETAVLVGKLVKQVSSSRQYFMPLLVIREDGPHRLQFIDKLVEDRTEHGTSYYEFLTHVNRQLSK